jgi:hypothetical protein
MTNDAERYKHIDTDIHLQYNTYHEEISVLQLSWLQLCVVHGGTFLQLSGHEDEQEGRHHYFQEPCQQLAQSRTKPSVVSPTHKITALCTKKLITKQQK